MIQFLTVDIGTTSMKAALFSRNKQMLNFTQVDLWEDSIQAPQEWASAFETIIERFSQELQDPERVCIVISGHGPSSVFLNSKNEVLYYIFWKSKKIIPLENELSSYIPQVMYLKKNHPNILKATTTILPPAEYLSFLLTDDKKVFISTPDYLPYVWNQESINTHILSHIMFPQPILSGTIISSADSKWAKTLKIGYGKVVAGGIDYMSAMLGSGTLSNGHIFLRCGASVVFNFIIEKRLYQPSQHTEGDNTCNPSFVSPGFSRKNIIVGYTINFFDQLYQSCLIQFKIPHKNQLPISQYRILKEQLSNIPSEIEQQIKFIGNKILQGKNSYQDIVDYINKTMPTKQLGIIFLALLLQQTKIYLTIIHNIFDKYCITPNKINASGGHTNDIVFMQLIADTLNTTVSIFNPTYTELYGNLLLGINALDNTKSYSKQTLNIVPSRKFIPNVMFE